MRQLFFRLKFWKCPKGKTETESAANSPNSLDLQHLLDELEAAYNSTEYKKPADKKSAEKKPTESDSNDSERGRPRKIISAFDRITLTLAQTLLLGGVIATAVGYVGCFTVVQSLAKPIGIAPVIWLILEFVLSILRIIIWGWNPAFDEAGDITLYLKLNETAPLPTWNQYADRFQKGTVLRLVRQKKFIQDVTSYVGQFEPFEVPGASILYALTRSDSVNLKRVLYIILFNYQEQSTRIITENITKRVVGGGPESAADDAMSTEPSFEIDVYTALDIQFDAQSDIITLTVNSTSPLESRAISADPILGDQIILGALKSHYQDVIRMLSSRDLIPGRGLIQQGIPLGWNLSSGGSNDKYETGESLASREAADKTSRSDAFPLQQSQPAGDDGESNLQIDASSTVSRSQSSPTLHLSRKQDKLYLNACTRQAERQDFSSQRGRHLQLCMEKLTAYLNKLLQTWVPELDPQEAEAVLYLLRFEWRWMEELHIHEVGKCEEALKQEYEQLIAELGGGEELTSLLWQEWAKHQRTRLELDMRASLTRLEQAFARLRYDFPFASNLPTVKPKFIGGDWAVDHEEIESRWNDAIRGDWRVELKVAEVRREGLQTWLCQHFEKVAGYRDYLDQTTPIGRCMLLCKRSLQRLQSFSDGIDFWPRNATGWSTFEAEESVAEVSHGQGGEWVQVDMEWTILRKDGALEWVVSGLPSAKAAFLRGTNPTAANIVAISNSKLPVMVFLHRVSSGLRARTRYSELIVDVRRSPRIDKLSSSRFVGSDFFSIRQGVIECPSGTGIIDFIPAPGHLPLLLTVVGDDFSFISGKKSFEQRGKRKATFVLSPGAHFEPSAAVRNTLILSKDARLLSIDILDSRGRALDHGAISDEQVRPSVSSFHITDHLCKFCFQASKWTALDYDPNALLLVTIPGGIARSVAIGSHLNVSHWREFTNLLSSSVPGTFTSLFLQSGWKPLEDENATEALQGAIRRLPQLCSITISCPDDMLVKLPREVSKLLESNELNRSGTLGAILLAEGACNFDSGCITLRGSNQGSPGSIRALVRIINPGAMRLLVHRIIPAREKEDLRRARRVAEVIVVTDQASSPLTPSRFGNIDDAGDYELASYLLENSSGLCQNKITIQPRPRVQEAGQVTVGDVRLLVDEDDKTYDLFSHNLSGVCTQTPLLCSTYN